jgi:hypothetical protein
MAVGERQKETASNEKPGEKNPKQNTIQNQPSNPEVVYNM